ncbi:hypothetical protein GCM10027037_19220 [Mucilaginibacter koreensis]
MKNFVKAALLAAGLFAAVQVNAQTVGQDLKNAGKDIGKAGKKVGHATAHTASKGAAAVVDKKYDGHYGPGGQTVYINDKSKYYYVNSKGHRVYVAKASLRTSKPM